MTILYCSPACFRTSLLCLALGLLSVFSVEGLSQEVKDIEKENFHLYLLVGQSNMAGRGKVTKKDKEPQARVLMFNKDREWVPAVDPLHFDKPIAGVGLGRTFGLEMAKADPNVVIGLIPCAVGGSPIAAWEPGGYHPSTKTHPWDDMKKRAEVALPHGVLKGILWHQGESDSNEKLAPLYEAKMLELIARFRKTFDAPEVPFLIGGMGEWQKKPWNEWKRQVDEVHRSIPSKVPSTAFVSSDGLKDRDGVHFDRESYLTFGKRYAEAYRKLRSQR
ncbi:MAG: sialate O-acetylesterase [Verrucomicrobiales bacterium]|nr:sialate O-acetylesterase [Verrucomicrobiales bacterium]